MTFYTKISTKTNSNNYSNLDNTTNYNTKNSNLSNFIIIIIIITLILRLIIIFLILYYTNIKPKTEIYSNFQAITNYNNNYKPYIKNLNLSDPY